MLRCVPRREIVNTNAFLTSLRYSKPALCVRHLITEIFKVDCANAIASKRLMRRMPKVIRFGPGKYRLRDDPLHREAALQVAIFQTPTDKLFIKSIDAVKVATKDTDIVACESWTHRQPEEIIDAGAKRLAFHSFSFACRNPMVEFSRTHVFARNISGNLFAQSIAITGDYALLATMMQVSCQMERRQNTVTVNE